MNVWNNITICCVAFCWLLRLCSPVEAACDTDCINGFNRCMTACPADDGGRKQCATDCFAQSETCFAVCKTRIPPPEEKTAEQAVRKTVEKRNEAREAFSSADAPQFDGAELFELISQKDTFNREWSKKLFDYARRVQEASVKGLDKLRMMTPEGEDRQFVEDWLFFEQCRFVVALALGDEGKRKDTIRLAQESETIRRNVQDNLRAAQDFSARLLQEKVDFLLDRLPKSPNLDAVLLQKPEVEPCVGDPCGHPTELFELRSYYEAAQRDITDEKGRNMLRAIYDNGANYGYRAYLYQRTDVEKTLNALDFVKDEKVRVIAAKFLGPFLEAAARLALFARDGLPKQRLEGLEMQFYSRYLLEFYQAKYYIALYNHDGKAMQVHLEKFPELLRQSPGLCTKHPEFLRREIVKKCREAGF